VVLGGGAVSYERGTLQGERKNLVSGVGAQARQDGVGARRSHQAHAERPLHHEPVILRYSSQFKNNYFAEGSVFEAHRLLYHSTLALRVMKKKKKKKVLRATRVPAQRLQSRSLMD